MPEQLPIGWVKTTLGEIAEPSRERVSPAEVPAMPYVGLEHIQPQTMRLLGHINARDVRSSSVRFSKGDVLYGKMRPYLNKVWVAEFDGLCSAEFLVFPKCEGLNSQFLATRLNAEDFVSFANGQVSGERPRVNFEKLSRFPILLPPTSEQQKIVAKLSTSLTGVGRAERAAGRARERLQRYHAAVLHAAITGTLTRAWREAQRKKGKKNSETGEALLKRLLISRRSSWEVSELRRLRTAGKPPKDDGWKSRYPEPARPIATDLTELPQQWIWTTVEQVGEVKLGRQRSPQHHTGRDMRPYLRVANVFEDRIDTSDVMRMNFTPREFEIYRLEEGDILLNEGQSLELVGRPAMFRNEIEGCCFQNTLVRFRGFDGLNRRYALIVFRAYLHTGRFREVAKITTNLAHLGADRFACIEFPLPSSDEQDEIVGGVDRRLTAASRLAIRLNTQMERARVARQHLLREAFTGGLVPQNPDERPATILIERIRAAREAQEPKGTRMAKSKLSVNVIGRKSLIEVLKEKGAPMTPEDLFLASGHSQESVDEFFAELRELTTAPAKIVEERRAEGVTLLKALP